MRIEPDVVVDSKQCKRCKYLRNTDLFFLCTHQDSQYKIGERMDFHTVSHVLKFEPMKCTKFTSL